MVAEPIDLHFIGTLNLDAGYGQTGFVDEGHGELVIGRAECDLELAAGRDGLGLAAQQAPWRASRRVDRHAHQVAGAGKREAPPSLCRLDLRQGPVLGPDRDRTRGRVPSLDA